MIPHPRFGAGLLATLVRGLVTVPAADRPAELHGAVTGTVLVGGEPPAPQTWKLDDAMRRATGEQTYTEETWLVGKDKGLANCLVMLRPKDPAQRPDEKPLPDVVLQKVGVRYVPRVLVVTPGTTVTLRNPGSPCRGFDVRGRFHDASYLIFEGKEQQDTFTRADVGTITCGVRPYMVGYIHVADTPFFAVTGADGRFRIADVPPGEYRVTVWHEAVGRLKRDAGPDELTVAAGGKRVLQYKVQIPGAGRPRSVHSLTQPAAAGRWGQGVPPPDAGRRP